MGVQPFCGTYAIAVCPLPRDFCVRLASAKEPAVFTLGGIEFGKKASSNAKPLTNRSDFCIALSRYENWREQNGTWAPGEREEHNVYTTTILGYVSTYGFSAAMAYDDLFRRHLFAGSNPAIQSWSGYDGRIWCECFMLPSNKPPPPPGPKPATAPTRAKPQPPPPPPGPKPLRGLQLTLSQLPFAEKDGAAGCRMFNNAHGVPSQLRAQSSLPRLRHGQRLPRGRPDVQAVSGASTGDSGSCSSTTGGPSRRN